MLQERNGLLGNGLSYRPGFGSAKQIIVSQHGKDLDILDPLWEGPKSR